MNMHHFLGMNVVLLVVMFLYRIWKKYSADINISIFRLFKCGIHQIRKFAENYLALDPAVENYEELYKRRKQNRIFIRTGIVFVLMQGCLVPNGYLLWIEALVAFIFLKDFSIFIKENETCIKRVFHSGNDTGNDDEQTNSDIRTESSDHSSIGDLNSKKQEIVINAAKGVLSIIMLYKLWFVSVVYLVLAALCFSLINRVLEQPLTKWLEYFQFDIFEGLEQFYVTGFLGFMEVCISFVFMTWTLLLHHQYLMLIALYTNVYITCKEVIHGAILSALAEWLILVQFKSATYDELKDLDDVCSICLSAMKKARKTKCNHFFHGHCLRRCLKEKNSCPYCNQKLIK